MSLADDLIKEGVSDDDSQLLATRLRDEGFTLELLLREDNLFAILTLVLRTEPKVALVSALQRVLSSKRSTKSSVNVEGPVGVVGSATIQVMNVVGEGEYARRRCEAYSRFCFRKEALCADRNE